VVGSLVGVSKCSSSSSPLSVMMVVRVCVAESVLPRPLAPFPLLPFPFLEVLVEEARVLREEEGVDGPERVEEEAWDLIFERRWVIALGVTSGVERRKI
jgi:hypothetical protein